MKVEVRKDGVRVVEPVVSEGADGVFAVSINDVLLPGWERTPEGVGKPFRCHTTQHTRACPMLPARGIEQCDEAAIARWEADAWAQAPYHYMLENIV